MSDDLNYKTVAELRDRLKISNGEISRAIKKSRAQVGRVLDRGEPGQPTLEAAWSYLKNVEKYAHLWDGESE